MNYYALETQMFDKQRETLHRAELRRLAATAKERPVGQNGPEPRVGLLTALANALRRKVTVGDAS